MTDIDVFGLFRTAFPESFIIEILILQTNINIKGEGVISSAVACFFHPNKPIRENWPDFKKKGLTGIAILGQGGHRISCTLVPNA